MTKEEMLASIEEIAIIPAIRVSSSDDALFASDALFNSGIPIVEITTTTPAAASVISQLTRANSQAIIGAGTVLDLETARICLEAGAGFLTSTGLDPQLVQFASEHNILMIPGALTPTEVMLARRAGAALIKLFPCSSMGGPPYLRALRGPFPDVRLIASGGVTQQTAMDYIRAGADVLGIGHDLLPSDALSARNAAWIQELARRFIAMVKLARNDKLKNASQRK